MQFKSGSVSITNENLAPTNTTCLHVDRRQAMDCLGQLKSEIASLRSIVNEISKSTSVVHEQYANRMKVTQLFSTFPLLILDRRWSWCTMSAATYTMSPLKKSPTSSLTFKAISGAGFMPDFFRNFPQSVCAYLIR